MVLSTSRSGFTLVLRATHTTHLPPCSHPAPHITSPALPGNGDLGDGSVLGTPDSMFQWVGTFVPLYIFPVALDVSRYGGPFEAMSFDIDTRDHSSFAAVAHCRMCLPVSVR